MSASCSEHAGPWRHHGHGFTLIELIAVLLLVSVLAVVALPRFDGVFAFRDDAWRSSLVAALQHARQTAVAHRRLVCVTLDTSGVSLRIAAANPASACTTALPGPDGQSTWAAASGTATSGTATSVSPTATIHFQPIGRATRDGAGTQVDTWRITITDQPAITLYGETGLVE
jgi:prepilin-type N-terminal cleavage/methylation domain-containing protein